MSLQVQWLTASPLWEELASTDKGAFRSPALLRFATDHFMQDLQGVLASKTPGDVRSFVAQAETWWSPAVGMISSTTSSSTTHSSSGTVAKSQSTTQPPFKFFQPVHLRYYLVSASLVCRLPGLPDHTVNPNQGESTAFVLRRLVAKSGLTKVDLSVFDPNTEDEYAWIPADQSGWVQATPATVAGSEEKLPLFALPYGTNGSRRRVFAGMIPVSRRQAYVAGRALQPSGNGQPPAPPPDDPRKIDFARKVLDPWAELLDYRDKTVSSSSSLPAVAALDQMTAGVAQASALILIDFAHFLQDQLLNVWNVIGGSAPPSSLSGKQLELYNALSTTTVINYDGSNPSNATNLAAAIKTASDNQPAFESEVLASQKLASGVVVQKLPDNYPGPLLVIFNINVPPYIANDPEPDLTALIARPGDGSSPRPIQTKVEAALDEVGAAPVSNVRVPAEAPKNPQGDDWYIVRCVYSRPQCGVAALPVISEPTRPFQLASFFDPDAPARPIQVALPVDTTPAALRKYDKNVAFMISDQLGKQMSRVKGLKQLMDGDMADPSLGLGMICSFSIPIITICAFIVLMIFLVLLNLIFWWLPFFRICFPLPTFKAKG
jgi:hypothetical protein